MIDRINAMFLPCFIVYFALRTETRCPLSAVQTTPNRQSIRCITVASPHCLASVHNWLVHSELEQSVNTNPLPVSTLATRAVLRFDQGFAQAQRHATDVALICAKPAPFT